jgi:hypothetical protein
MRGNHSDRLGRLEAATLAALGKRGVPDDLRDALDRLDARKAAGDPTAQAEIEAILAAVTEGKTDAT